MCPYILITLQLNRLFLMREMNIENLTFYDEAMKFKSYINSTSSMIYHTYIKEAAPSQVNISATQRAAIEKIYPIPGTSYLYYFIFH